MATKSVPNLNCDVPALWLDHKLALKSYIQKRVKDQDLTDDLLQEVLLKVYGFCTSSSGVRNVRSWLFQIAHNSIIDNYRKQAKFTTNNLPELEQEDENLAFKEALDYIVPLVNFLPAKYAEALKLSDIEGLQQKEVASRLNLSLTATKSRIQRARKLLKEKFIICCHIETDMSGKLISFDIKDSCTPLLQVKKRIHK